MGDEVISSCANAPSVLQEVGEGMRERCKGRSEGERMSIRDRSMGD